MPDPHHFPARIEQPFLRGGVAVGQGLRIVHRPVDEHRHRAAVVRSVGEIRPNLEGIDAALRLRRESQTAFFDVGEKVMFQR